MHNIYVRSYVYGTVSLNSNLMLTCVQLTAALHVSSETF